MELSTLRASILAWNRRALSLETVLEELVSLGVLSPNVDYQKFFEEEL